MNDVLKKEIENKIQNLELQNDEYYNEIGRLQKMIEELKLKSGVNTDEINKLKNNPFVQMEEISLIEQIVRNRILLLQSKKKQQQGSLQGQKIEQKRNLYTKSEKEDILKGLEFYSGSELQEITGIHQNLFYKWKRAKFQTKNRGGRQVKSQQLENLLIEYVQKHREEKQILTRKMLTQKAKKIAKEKKIYHSVSIGYTTCFMKRNNFKIRRINSTKRFFAREEEIQEFILQFRKEINTHKYDLNHVLNFDETSVSKQCERNYTIAHKNEKHVKVENPQNTQRYSLGLAVSQNAKNLKQHILWPSKGKKNLFKINIPDNILITYSNNKSFFNKKFFQEWIEKIFVPYSKSKEKNKQGLLLIDNFSAHKYERFAERLKEIEYAIMYLPANSTDRLQPLYLTVNKQYKSKVYELIQKIQEENEKKFQDKTISHGQFLKLLKNCWKTIDVSNSWNIYKEEKDIPIKDTQNRIIDETVYETEKITSDKQLQEDEDSFVILIEEDQSDTDYDKSKQFESNSSNSESLYDDRDQLSEETD